MTAATLAPASSPAAPIYCDAHTHLDQYEQFAPDEIPAILQRAREAGVGYILLAGTTLESTERCVALANGQPMFYAGVGIHPMHAYDPVDDALYARLETLARDNPRVVCISEVGLDYLPDSPDHAVQDQVFRQHIHLAKSLNLPIIFHSRESHPAVFKILREENAGQVGGAMHYFQGDWDTARAAIDAGFFISLARPLTRLPELRAVARQIPLDNIVLETDAYPQPFKKHRHNWTEPRHLAEVAQCLAAVKGISVDEVAEVTTANLSRLLRLDIPAGAGAGAGAAVNPPQ